MAATKAASKPSFISEWTDPFPVEEVKQRPLKKGSSKMLSYVDWTAFVRRLNGLVENEIIQSWEWTINSQETLPNTINDEYGFYCVGHLHIKLLDGTRVFGGSGAGEGSDADNAIKTAQAEAFKKACHVAGGSLELWDADYREQAGLEGGSKPKEPNLQDLKDAVYEKALELAETDALSPDEVADLFGVDVKDLNDPDTLKEILE